MDIPSLFMIPSAVSSGKVHSVFPNSTDADFDFNRDSDATRVNSEGLIERVGYYSADKITNGDFSTDSDWVKDTGWSISGGKLNFNGTLANNARQAVSGYNTTSDYEVTFDLTIESGGAYIMLGYNALTTRTTSGTYTQQGKFTDSGAFNGFLRIFSTGTSVFSVDNVSIKEVTGNRARLNYEIEGGLVNTKPSLLLEPQSTNLLTYSENFLSSLWTVIPSYTKNAVVTKVNSKNPYGTYESYQYKNVNQGEAQSQLGALVSASIGATYTSSIYIRRVKGTGTITFRNINNGTNDITSQVTSEWKRFTTTATAAGSVARVYINLGTEGDIIEVFGAQLEQQSYATSYIPTNGSTQTRAAETCNGAGTSSILPSEEGILYIETSVIGLTSTLESISISDGTYNNAILFRYFDTSDNQIQYVVRVGSSIVAAINFTLSDALAFNKIALKYKANDFALWANGTQVGTDTSGAMPSGLSTLQLDRGDGNSDFYGKIRDIRVYNTKEMTDSEVDILLTKITS